MTYREIAKRIMGAGVEARPDFETILSIISTWYGEGNRGVEFPDACPFSGFDVDHIVGLQEKIEASGIEF